MRLSPNATGALMGLVSFALFAGHDALIKGLAGRYSAIQISFTIACFSFPLLIGMLATDRTVGTLLPVNRYWVILRGITGTFGAVTAFYAFRLLPFAEVYVLLFATPLLVTVLAVPLLGEKVGLRRALAVITGLIGVLIVLRPGTSGFSMGHIAALAAALCGATSAIITRRVGRQERPAVFVIYVTMTNFTLMGMALPLVYVPMTGPDLAIMALVALLAFTGMQFMIQSYRRAEAGVVAPMQYSQMVWAIFYGAMFFDETPDAVTLIGAAIVSASGLYIVLREARLKTGAAAGGVVPQSNTSTCSETAKNPE